MTAHGVSICNGPMVVWNTAAGVGEVRSMWSMFCSRPTSLSSTATLRKRVKESAANWGPFLPLPPLLLFPFAAPLLSRLPPPFLLPFPPLLFASATPGLMVFVQTIGI